jgi:hypothetical protein
MGMTRTASSLVEGFNRVFFTILFIIFIKIKLKINKILI